ncbi:hypothetical protein PAPYR_1066 [Paratrimastix pyriformis]|uniref:Uncharacterized protein n=1 Tax=Paratrimastix pyriformis TaxID=342808 RepID=A0ABQ8UTG9_9EUKA|nr:hypothetical protein PAPYR_1066 [Paratrimastix pyriformis]
MPWKDEELQIRRISSENIRYMCDIKAKATTVRLTKISFGRTGSNSGCHVQIFIRMGTYREHVQSESGWRRVCDQTRDMRELQPDTLQHFQLRPPLELQAGQTGAIYIHTSDSSGIAFSSSVCPAPRWGCPMPRWGCHTSLPGPPAQPRGAHTPPRWLRGCWDWVAWDWLGTGLGLAWGWLGADWDWLGLQTYPADSRDLENADVRISTGLYLSGSAPFSSPGNERHFLGTFEYEASAE